MLPISSASSTFNILDSIQFRAKDFSDVLLHMWFGLNLYVRKMLLASGLFHGLIKQGEFSVVIYF